MVVSTDMADQGQRQCSLTVGVLLEIRELLRRELGLVLSHDGVFADNELEDEVSLRVVVDDDGGGMEC